MALAGPTSQDAAQEDLSALPRLPLTAKLTYVMGMLGYVAMLRMMTGWLQKHLVPPEAATVAVTNVIVPLWVFVTVMVVGRVYFDSVTDPVIGYWSDHTKTRWGRRKPFILAGGIPCVVCFVGLFALTPESIFGLFEAPREMVIAVNSLLYTVLVTVFWIATTLMAMPYLALLPEITPHPEDRRQVSTMLGIMVVFGVVLGQVLPGLMVSLFNAALLMAGIGIFCFAAVLFTFRVPKEMRTKGYLEEETKPSPAPHESATTASPGTRAALTAWPHGHAVTEGAESEREPEVQRKDDDDTPVLDFRSGIVLLWHTMWFAIILAPRTLRYLGLKALGEDVKFFRAPPPRLGTDHADDVPQDEAPENEGAPASGEQSDAALSSRSLLEARAATEPYEGTFIAVPERVPEPLQPLGASMRSIFTFKPFIGFLGAFVALHASFVLVTNALPYMPQTMLAVNDARNYVLVASGEPIPVPDPVGAFGASVLGHDASPFADDPLLPKETLEAVRLELTDGDPDAPLDGQVLGEELVQRGLLTSAENAKVAGASGALDKHGNFRASAFFALCLAAAFFVGIPMWYLMLRFIGKRITASFCILLFILGPSFAPIAGMPWVPVPDWAVIYAICVVTGLGLAGIFVIEYLMLADVVQLDTMRTGLRRESLYFGLFGLMMKIGIGIALLVSGVSFALFGYAYLADWGVRLAGPGSSLIAIVGAVLFWTYYPTDKEMAEGRLHGERQPPERVRQYLEERATD